MQELITFEHVCSAREAIKGKVVYTPAIRVYELEQCFQGAEIYLKLENMQLTGSFKLRGATNKLMSLGEKELQRGVIAASSGNHAQAVAYAATRLGVKSTIVMPEDAPKVKVERTRAFGAQVELCGFTGEDRDRWAQELVEKTGGTLVHSHADPYVIAGQGTVAMEFLEQVSDLDQIVTPLGASGLLCGTLIAVHGMRGKSLPVTGVEPAGVPRMTESLAKGEPVRVPMGKTLADGLRVSTAAPLNYSIISRYRPDIRLQDDTGIPEMMLYLLQAQKIVAEPSAVIGLAAAYAGKVDTNKGKKIGFIITGGNVDGAFLKGIL